MQMQQGFGAIISKLQEEGTLTREGSANSLRSLKETLITSELNSALDGEKTRQVSEKQLAALEKARAARGKAKPEGAADKEKEQKEDARQNKLLSMIGNLGKGIGNLVKGAEKKAGDELKGAFGGLMNVVKPLLKILKGALLIGALYFLLDTFEGILKFVENPSWEGLGNILKSLGTTLLFVAAAFPKTAFSLITKALPLLKVGFLALKGFFVGTLLPAITGFLVPLAPIIAIVAGIALVLYSLWGAFKEAKKTFDETGSITEALKVGISSFFGKLLGFIPDMILKLVGWVAGLFGFDDFKKKVQTVDVTQWITDKVAKLIDGIINWFKLLFSDPVEGLKKLWLGILGGYSSLIDLVFWPIDKAINMIGQWFGWTDPEEPFSLKTFLGDKIKEGIKWVGTLFGFDEKEINKLLDFSLTDFLFGKDGIVTSVVNFFKNIFSPDFDIMKSVEKAIDNIFGKFTDMFNKIINFDFMGWITENIAGVGEVIEVVSGVAGAVSSLVGGDDDDEAEEKRKEQLQEAQDASDVVKKRRAELAKLEKEAEAKGGFDKLDQSSWTGLSKNDIIEAREELAEAEELKRKAQEKITPKPTPSTPSVVNPVTKSASLDNKTASGSMKVKDMTEKLTRAAAEKDNAAVTPDPAPAGGNVVNAPVNNVTNATNTTSSSTVLVPQNNTLQAMRQGSDF